MLIDEIIESIVALRDASTTQEASVLQQAIDRIGEAESLSAAQHARLMDAFSDASTFQDVLWSLLHVLESKGLDHFVSAYVRRLPSLQQRAPEWAETIACRLVNSARRQARFVDQLRGNRDSITAARAVLTLVLGAKGAVAQNARSALDALDRPD